MKTATAILRNWKRIEHPQGHYYWGNVYDDIKERFKDGARIHTSHVVREEDKGTYLEVHTLNSIYILRKDNDN